MNEILRKIGKLIQDPSVRVDLTGFIFALLVSAIVAGIVSALYSVFYENKSTGAQIHRSFLLLAPSITALFIAIQFSLPLSLGLLGALSIIRFRTPIKEPEEVGFIMLLIATSVICATFQFILLFCLLVLVALLLWIQRHLPRMMGQKRENGVLLLTVSDDVGPEGQKRLLETLGEHFTRGSVLGISIGEGLVTIHYGFSDMAIEKVNEVTARVRKIAPVERMNVYFNRHGALS